MGSEKKLKELQFVELQMLKDIAAVCNKLGIRYYAADGTLLGAIRHKGFIPWDNDIDICMSREDYEKFISEAPKHLPDNLKVKTYMDSEDNAIYTARVVKIDTKLIIRFSNVAREDNAWIDLWALDGMPGNAVKNKLHRIHLLFNRMLVQFSKYDELVHQHRQNRPWYEKAIMKFCEITHLGRSIDTKRAKARTERTMQKYNIKDCRYAVNFWSAYKFKEQVPVQWYGNGKEVEFEDVLIRVPDHAEKILERLYGDYTKLPPESERHNQHCMEIVHI